MLCRTLSLLAAVALCASCDPPSTFVSDAGIGPDKWGSVWLIRRHVDPDAEIVIGETRVAGAVAFDTDSATLRRTPGSTTFEKLLERYTVDDRTARRIGRIVRDMEINTWGAKTIEASAAVESRYRILQQRHGRESIPEHCYLAFFDTLSREIERGRSTTAIDGALADLPCDPAEKPAQPAAVAELPLAAVLEQLRLGREVIFVDTREAIEYAEYHIPGAVRYPLREIDAALAGRLATADLVVTYCVKDFRGYEAARRLQRLGVHEVAIMNPYGIKGWRQAGLPVVLPDGPGEAAGIAELMACAADPENCLATDPSRPTS